jgi:hypothetical protein
MFKARPSFLSPRPAAIACLAFIAALSNPSPGHAAEANAANWYFSPHLTEDRNPALCQALERAVVGRFFTTKEMDNLEDEPTLNGPDIEWVIKRKEYDPWDTPGDDGVGHGFNVFTLTDDDGMEMHLALYWHVERHWNNYYGLALLDNPGQLDALVEKIMAGASEDDDYDDYRVRRDLFYGDLRRYAIDWGDWRVRPVFQYGGAVYVLSDSYDIFSVRAWGDPWIPWLDAGKAFPVTLTRLHADGRLETTCRIATHAPREQRHRIAQQMKAPRYFAALRPMMGLDQVCPGTANIASRHMTYTTTLRADSLLRPWAFEGVDRYLRPEVIQAYLEQWAGESLWNHLHYQEFLAARAEFRQGLSAVLTDRLGLTAVEAEAKADWVIESLDHGHFRFSSNTGHWLNIDEYGRVPLEKRLARATGDPIRGRRTLNLALLAGVDWVTIEGYLKAEAAATHLTPPRLLTHPIEERPWIPVESPVVFALPHPELVAALHNLGLPIDQPNVFGKTPLMYAAQFDLLETARLLLDLGADPTAVTTESPECTTAVKINGRTALTYAAENAGEDMIKLLLQKGADPLATDSAGRGLEDYLRLNRRLGTKQRRKLAVTGQALVPR